MPAIFTSEPTGFMNMVDNYILLREKTYGYFDNLDRGVDYPFLNTSHYPFADITFRLIPEGVNYNEELNGIDFPIKPLIDGCE